MGLKQIEYCHILSHAKVTLPDRKRLHYKGSSVGDLIQDVELPAPDGPNEWQMQWGGTKRNATRNTCMP